MTNGNHPEGGGGTKRAAEKPTQDRERTEKAERTEKKAPAEVRPAKPIDRT